MKLNTNGLMKVGLAMMLTLITVQVNAQRIQPEAVTGQMLLSTTRIIVDSTIVRDTVTATIPIFINNMAWGDSLRAFDLRFTFKDGLEYVGIDTVNTLASGANLLLVNGAGGGRNISIANADTLPFTGGGAANQDDLTFRSDTLIKIQVRALDAGDYTFYPYYVALNDTIVNPDSIKYWELSYAPYLGDVDSNNVIQAFDASNILLHSIGRSVLNDDNWPWDRWRQVAGDVDGDADSADVGLASFGGIPNAFMDNTSAGAGTDDADDDTLSGATTDYTVVFASQFGEPDAYDASLVLQKAVGAIVNYPGQSKAVTPKVSVTIKNSELVFSVDGGLISFETSLRERETFKLKEPKISWSNALFGWNRTHPQTQRYVVSIAAAKTTSDVFLRIPLEEVPGQGCIQVPMMINNKIVVERVCVDAAPVQPEEETLPDMIELDQNYPNPFNPGTRIPFRVNEATEMKLEVYTVLGQKVATLVDGFKEVGYYTVDFAGVGLNSGVYVYQISTPSFLITRNMMLVK